MHIAHSQLTIPEKVKTPNKRQLYHADMVAAKRRREFMDFEAALKDPEIIELIKKVQEVIPGWQPKFRG